MKYIQPHVGAKRIGVQPATVRRWLRNKLIPNVIKTPGGRYLIPQDEWDAFIASLALAIPSADKHGPARTGAGVAQQGRSS